MRRGVSVAKQTQRKHNKIRRKLGLPQTDLKTRQLYIRYSYLINRRFNRKTGKGERQGENFITYAHRASATMKAPEMKRQIRNHPKKLKEAIINGK
jgi:RNA-directed DNA polymerase